MKFDKRNPFAAWGHEQEVYTTSGENETIKFEQKQYISLINTEDNTLFVNDGEFAEKAGSFEKDSQEVFFTNDDNTLDALYSAKRMVEGEDIERNTNEELKYFGIHADDWKLYGEKEESEEGGGEEDEPENPGEEDEPETEDPQNETTLVKEIKVGMDGVYAKDATTTYNFKTFESALSELVNGYDRVYPTLEAAAEQNGEYTGFSGVTVAKWDNDKWNVEDSFYVHNEEVEEKANSIKSEIEAIIESLCSDIKTTEFYSEPANTVE